MKNVFLLVVFFSVIPLFAQKNLIRNGSFELDTDSWRGENILTINPYNKRTGESLFTDDMKVTFNK